ncbi:MAG: vWA domain-containing protein [Halothece sp.]
MLNVSITPHREFLPSEQDNQKLFTMLKLRPTQEVANTRPSTSFVFIIDTSGSMREVVEGETEATGEIAEIDGQRYNVVTGGKTKIDIVIESLKALIQSGKLGSSDRVSIVQFDDQASTVIELTPATETQQLEDAIDSLKEYSGGTRMGLGLRRAFEQLSDQKMTSRRVLVFTDGATFDEDQCNKIAPEFNQYNIPITALAVGEEYNEDLLTKLSDTTAGSLNHVVAGTATGTQVAISNLPNTILEEYTRAQEDVINNLALTVKTVKGVKLTRLVRAYLTPAEFSLEHDPYPIGNASANDETIFILEFTIDSRPASRVRIAQLGLTYDVPGKNYRGELPPQNLVVQLVAGSNVATPVDQEVMHYMQQCNIADIVKRATQMADSNPEKAGEMIETARRMTQKMGNKELTESLNGAQEELRKTRKISSGTRKTVKMGAKGKTVKMTGDDVNNELTDEKIRQATGT